MPRLSSENEDSTVLLCVPSGFAYCPGRGPQRPGLAAELAARLHHRGHHPRQVSRGAGRRERRRPGAVRAEHGAGPGRPGGRHPPPAGAGVPGDPHDPDHLQRPGLQRRLRPGPAGRHRLRPAGPDQGARARAGTLSRGSGTPWPGPGSARPRPAVPGRHARGRQARAPGPVPVPDRDSTGPGRPPGRMAGMAGRARPRVRVCPVARLAGHHHLPRHADGPVPADRADLRPVDAPRLPAAALRRA